jgi:hypothetical protein
MNKQLMDPVVITVSFPCNIFHSCGNTVWFLSSNILITQVKMNANIYEQLTKNIKYEIFATTEYKM